LAKPCDEPVQLRVRVFGRDRVAKGFKIAEMIVKALLDQINHLAGSSHRVRPRRARELEIRGQGLAIVLIEIPLPADRFVAVHQQIPVSRRISR
jgi:hypothetical protein